MINFTIFEDSKKYMPGGVNSPVRCFKGMDITPPILREGNGVIVEDEEGREYIDFVLAWGPMILGHNNKEVVDALTKQATKGLAFGAPTLSELKMSEFLCKEMDNVDMVRMVNSGTEATMSAIKLARGYTGRDKIVKFGGCYHGHFDGFLVEAGSGVLTEGIAGSPGVPCESIKNTLVARYNDESSIEEVFKAYGNEIAGVIIEPVAGNMGVIKANKSFMKKLRALCDEYGSLLIFDEVMSGFRVSFRGAQKLFNEKPDLITYAKIMGGGLPCGAYGGKKEIMSRLSPLGDVYQAGTMSGNPMVMAAGLATLNHLKKNQSIYEKINEIGLELENGVKLIAKEHGIPLRVNRVGGMMTIFFNDGSKVECYEDVKKCDLNLFKRYFLHMLKSGLYLPPSQFEAVFLSSEHTILHVQKFLQAFEEFCVVEKNEEE
ncbi:MAG: glutamate-1-semialdehyde 2,1-aminomutase [Clostridium sp.]